MFSSHTDALLDTTLVSTLTFFPSLWVSITHRNGFSGSHRSSSQRLRQQMHPRQSVFNLICQDDSSDPKLCDTQCCEQEQSTTSSQLSLSGKVMVC